MKLSDRLKLLSFYRVEGTPDLFLTADDTSLLLGASPQVVKQMAAATKWTRSHIVKLKGELAARTLYPVDSILAFAFNRWDTQCGDFRTFIADRVNRLFSDGFCSLEEWKLSREWRVKLALLLFPEVGTGPSGTGPSGTGPSGTGPSGTGPSGIDPLPLLSVEQVARLRALDLAVFLLTQLLPLSVEEVLARLFPAD